MYTLSFGDLLVGNFTWSFMFVLLSNIMQFRHEFMQKLVFHPYLSRALFLAMLFFSGTPYSQSCSHTWNLLITTSLYSIASSEQDSPICWPLTSST